MGLICMEQRGFRRSVLEGEIALGVARPSSSNTGVHALDLVYQAAGVFRSIEDRARETEARAEAAERGQRELIAITERKLSDASKALEEAQKRIEAQQDRLSAIEYRAQAAEADARDAKQTLAQVEEAIRSRLLFTSAETGRLDTAGPGASGESQEPDAPGDVPGDGCGWLEAERRARQAPKWSWQRDTNSDDAI